MKSIVIATLLSLTLAATAFAKPASFKSCTADQKVTILYVEVEEHAGESVLKNLKKAFDGAANALPASRLVTKEGFLLFVSGLSDEAKAVTDIPQPPQIVEGSCKAS